MNINFGGMNMGMGMGMGMMMQEPVYQQINVGIGINQQEFQTIVTCCKQVYMQRGMGMASQAAKAIKQYLGGEWFVITGNTFQKNYDFCVTSVEGGDFMSFSLDQTLFQIVKIKGSQFGFGMFR